MTKDGKPETLQEMRSMGGDARAKSMTKARRIEIARKAAKARHLRARKLRACKQDRPA